MRWLGWMLSIIVLSVAAGCADDGPKVQPAPVPQAGNPDANRYYIDPEKPMPPAPAPRQ